MTCKWIRHPQERTRVHRDRASLIAQARPRASAHRGRLGQRRRIRRTPPGWASDSARCRCQERLESFRWFACRARQLCRNGRGHHSAETAHTGDGAARNGRSSASHFDAAAAGRRGTAFRDRGARCNSREGRSRGRAFGHQVLQCALLSQRGCARDLDSRVDQLSRWSVFPLVSIFGPAGLGTVLAQRNLEGKCVGRPFGMLPSPRR